MQQTYHLDFFKTVSDSTGHPVDAWQGAVEVRATNRDTAIELGRRKFAELKDVAAWSLRADYQTVQPVVAVRASARSGHSLTRAR